MVTATKLPPPKVFNSELTQCGKHCKVVEGLPSIDV